MRGSEIYISIDTWKRLKAYCDLVNLSCVDAAAEMILTDALKEYQAIDELMEAQDKAKKAIREKWAALNKRAGSVSEQP